MSTSHTRARRVKGLIAGACGAALLLAGGTWALWYDSSEVHHGIIVAGNLDIAPALDPAGNANNVVYDISDIVGVNDANPAYPGTSTEPRKFAPDPSGTHPRLDQDPVNWPLNPGAPYDPDDWKAVQLDQEFSCLSDDPSWGGYAGVIGHEARTGAGYAYKDSIAGWPYTVSPGDTLLSVYPYHVALDGDNMVANLEVRATAGYGVDTLGNTYTPNPDAFSEFEAVALISLDVDNTSWQSFPLVQVGQPGISDAADAATAWMNSYNSPVSALLQGQNQQWGDRELGSNVGGIWPIYKKALTPNELAGTAKKDANVCIVVKATFDPDTQKQAFTEDVLAVLPPLGVTLEQTRKLGVGSF
ncbi:MAG: SipW-dependent-type signal peptide-containing protein [Bifidobacteriaceae bacterium]|jgi:predicted ribosomally synthesized peptide with SipW-like signal peptide|nr:SipW-dependent-type signal peptide-containing protein [Bifidobacteriaceae bacterium]